MNTDKKRRARLAKVYTVKIREDIAKMIERANHFALPERQVTLQTAVEVANRDLRRTLDMHPDRRAFSALKAVSAHIALATNNKYTSASLSNSDLLPIGHPMSTATHAMTSSALAHAQARWIAADRLIADDVRALVASAYSLEPESIARKHAFARLAATPTTSVPRLYTLDPITAAFGLGIGGDSKAARSLRAHLQRRDRYGRFAFMGGGFSFNLRGLDGMFSKFGGRVVGAGGNNSVEVEVTDHPTIPDGIYSLPAGKGISSKAWLPESVDVKQSQSSTDLFIDEGNLQRLDAPSGWDLQPSAPGEPQVWTSKDGYFVQKDGDTLSLHRANLEDNTIGDQVASGTSWADIQEATIADQDAYAKVLEADAAKGKPGIFKPQQPSTDDGYDAIRDQMLEEGWSKSGGNPAYGYDRTSKDPAAHWEAELGRRAMAKDAARGDIAEWEYTPRDPSKNVSTWSNDKNSVIIDWAKQQDGDFYKSVVQQHAARNGKLTQKQWDALEKGFLKDKNHVNFDGTPKDMTPEEKAALIDWATSTPYIGTTKELNTAGFGVATSDGKSIDAMQSSRESFIKSLNDGKYVSTDSWERLRNEKAKYKAPEDTQLPVIKDDPLNKDNKEGSTIANNIAQQGWNALDQVGPGKAGNEYYLTKAEYNLALAESMHDHIGSSEDDRLIASNLRDAIDRVKNAVPEEAAVPEVQAEIPAAPEAPAAQAPDVIDFNPAGKIEDGRKFIADAKANKQKIRFMYNNKERVVSPQEIWINGQTGRINLRAVDSDGTKKNFSLDKITAPEPIAPAEAPAAVIPDFVSPDAAREVLDDGLSTVNAALGDIPDEDLDNLDSEDSDAITKVGDLLDSAQNAIDKIDPVGSSTNDLHFEQASADLGEAAQILSEANNGDMQNAGFDLKEAVDNFIALPQIDFGGGRAERSVAETPVQDTTPDGVVSMDSILTEEFDSMFDTPDGSYKPDIFGYYEPKGRTVEDSANYTDDPEVLAGMFSPQELVLALRDAVLPIDGEDAPGRGALEFSDGPEFVPAEALYHAIEKSGDGDLALANIYDMDLDPNREMTNAERISMFKEDALIDPLGGNEITKPTTRDAEVLKAVDRNKEIGKPTKAQVATDLMLEHDEQNQSIISLADDLIAKQDDGLGYDSFNLQDTLVQYLPWSVSNDPNEREAFKGLWGMMMSLDGGSSNEDITPESLADPEAFRTIIYNSLLEIHGGDDTVAMDAYNELIDNFGGMPEFVAGKDAIASGKDNLSSDTTAAAFYRLVATSSRPNQTSLYRSIAVKNNDPLLEKYTTEGSLFGMDARSFTSTNITDGSLSSKLFYPAGSGESRIIFEVAPGETKSIDASTISWFAGENEHFSFGNFEVLSVKKQQGLGGNPEYVVKVRNTDTKEVAAPIAEGISYSGIEDWKKVGGQMGSNVGGTFEDPNGNQYYVKIPKSPSHAQNESLASALYREAGIDAVEVNLGFSDGELRTISPLVPNSSTDLQTKLDDPEYMKKLQEGFAVDAWLANWDVAGLTFDNVITDGNGNPVRVDPGGALMWRAQGAPKGKLFGDKVNEIDSLRDPDLNPTSSEVFGSMTDEDISNSAAKLAGITPERIDSIVDSIVTDPDEAATLKDRLKKRRDDILRRFAPKDKILNENTPLPLEEDPNAPQPPSDPNDVNAMNEYKGALADYEINKAVSDVWDCPPGGLTAAGDKNCTTPSVDDLIDNVTSKTDAVGVRDNTVTEKKILDDIIDFIDDIQKENLKPSTKQKARDIADEITAIREGLKDGSITNDQAIARLNTLSDSIPVGGTSADADTLEVIGETIDDYRRILDGSFEDRPMSENYPPAGSGGKGYAKDKTTFLKIGMRVRNKWGYAGTVDRYDKNSWQVWVTMDIDPSGQFAPGYKKMSFSTKTLDAIQEGGDDSPWIDLPGTPEGKKPKSGVTPTKVPPKGSPAEKYSKEVADKIAKSGKAAKPPKAEAPQGAPEVPEVATPEVKVEEPAVPETPEVSAPEALSIPEPIAKFSKGKVTGTGAKKIVVENPPPFEYSAFDEVPSMRGALDSLTDENVKFAKVRGASAAFDGGDIEDLEVRVEGIIDEERKESTRISYKLTSWAGDDLAKSIDAGDGEWDIVPGVSIPRTAVDEATGAILIKTPRGSDSMTAYSNMGKTYVADAGNGIKVTLRRTPDTASALHNYVTIDMPYGTTDEEVARAMTIAGVADPRPATTTDFRILAENRLMSIFSGHTNAESNIKVATTREARLMDIEKKFGITPDDVKIRVGTSGQIETVIPEEVGKKIAEMTRADTLEHDFALHSFAKLEADRRGVGYNNLSAEDKETAIINGLIDFFVGPRGGGLVGTRARYFTGMQIEGMSSTSDLGTGGADYVFLRPSNGGNRHKGGVYGEYGAELAFDAAKAYTRLDWYANESDKFGRRSKKTDVIKNASLGAYEVMFKKRLGLESLRSLALNEDFREKVLVEFNKRGITEINGKPVDEVIVIAGRPGDPSGKFAKVSKPLTDKLENLGAYGVGMSDLTPGLNTLIGTKFLSPPWDTKAYAISSDMKKVIAKNKGNQYMIYTSDGKQSVIDDSDIPTIVDSFGSPTSEYSLFFKNEIDYAKTAVTDIVSKYTSGEATPEATARALMAIMKQAPSYGTLIDIKNIINSKLDLAAAWKKIKEEL